MSKYHYREIPVGSRVRIMGERDAHSREEGEVLKAQTLGNYVVRIGGRVFVKPGRILQVLTLGVRRPNTVRRGERENLSACIRLAYKKLKEKDPAYAAFIDRNTIKSGRMIEDRKRGGA